MSKTAYSKRRERLSLAFRFRMTIMVVMALANCPGQTGVRIPEDQVRRLKAVAPAHLRGASRKNGVLVSWAIEELLRLKDESKGQQKADRAAKN